jgi:hypothetical protein
VAVNVPEESVPTCRNTSPVASLITFTFAPEITAWYASCTVPVIAPVAPPCAKASALQHSTASTIANLPKRDIRASHEQFEPVSKTNQYKIRNYSHLLRVFVSLRL